MIITENKVLGLCKLSQYINYYLEKSSEHYHNEDFDFEILLKRCEIENSWFTMENQKCALKQWANVLNEENINNWLNNYKVSNTPKRVGLILAGNIPLVGFHDVVSTILSGHIPNIKLSSKDQLMIPFLLKKWNEFSVGNISYEIVERIERIDAVIATGSNNTARYLEFYFKDYLSIIRKNRTSIAVLKGDETDEELQLLAEDIFRYFGLGCRNVTRILMPQNFDIAKLFENFLNFKQIINHHKYANNYEYNRAIYLLNQEKFWDNNFVMLKEDDSLFSPLAVLNFNRYNHFEEVKNFIKENENDIQCVVAKSELGLDSKNFGDAQNPSLDTYADNVDTMRFLEIV